MIKGLMSGAGSLDVYERRQEVTAANLANLATPGYRRRLAVLTANELPGPGRGAGNTVPRLKVQADFTPGDVVTTGDPMDLALSGDTQTGGNAFFAVTSPTGEELYARSVRLEMGPDGSLLHASSGFPLAGANGSAIRLIPGGGAPTIDAGGAVFQNGEEIGRLKVVRFQNLDGVMPLDGGLYDGSAAGAKNSAVGIVNVLQGHKENSNANAVVELVNLITNYRSYEASQKVLKQVDQSLQRLLRTVTQ